MGIKIAANEAQSWRPTKPGAPATNFFQLIAL
jgi:hypothetical protein